MKKLLSASIILLVILCLTVSAVDGVTIKTDSVSVKSGETVLVPIYIENNVGFAGFSFELHYNDSHLTPVAVKNGVAFEGSITSNVQQNSASGIVTLIGASATNSTESGILCYVKFEASDSFSGETALTLVNKGLVNQDHEKLTPTIAHGKVTVSKDVEEDVIIIPPSTDIPAISPTPIVPEKEEEPKEISVYIDGKAVKFDVAPVIIDGRTLVPMRAIFEQLGAYVWWEDEIKTAIGVKDSIMVAIAIDKPTMRKNDKDLALDVPAKLIDSRTMVPLRAISEAYGCKVEWIDAKKQINIYTKGE